MIDRYIDDLEAELRAAAARRGRLAVARIPRPPVGALATGLAVVVCLAVGGVFLGLHGSTRTARPAHTNAPLSFALGPEAPGFSGQAPASADQALIRAARAAAGGAATPPG